MVRQFRIQGIDTGKSYSLNDFNKFLLTLPQGLGFEFKNTFLKVGNQRILEDKEYQFREINGTIEISGNTRTEWEKNYNELKEFVIKNQKSGFRLYYKTVDEERYIVCNLKLLNKTEKTTYALLVPIVLETRSLWAKDYSFIGKVEQVSIEGENLVAFLQQEDGSYSYNYLYEPETNDYNAKYLVGLFGEVDLINDGDDEVPLIIKLKSSCQNPFLVLKDISGNIISSSKVYITLNEGDVLTLDSSVENLSIKIIRASGIVEDVTKNIDLSLTTFITLPIGHYILEVRDELENYIETTVEFSKRYIGG